MISYVVTKDSKIMVNGISHLLNKYDILIMEDMEDMEDMGDMGDTYSTLYDMPYNDISDASETKTDKTPSKYKTEYRTGLDVFKDDIKALRYLGHLSKIDMTDTSNAELKRNIRKYLHAIADERQIHLTEVAKEYLENVELLNKLTYAISDPYAFTKDSLRRIEQFREEMEASEQYQGEEYHQELAKINQVYDKKIEEIDQNKNKYKKIDDEEIRPKVKEFLNWLIIDSQRRKAFKDTSPSVQPMGQPVDFNRNVYDTDTDDIDDIDTSDTDIDTDIDTSEITTEILNWSQKIIDKTDLNKFHKLITDYSTYVGNKIQFVNQMSLNLFKKIISKYGEENEINKFVKKYIL